MRHDDLDTSETILLVEDDDPVRRLVTVLLQQLGYAVQTARTGEEALEFAESRSEVIDLLLSDVVMPGMNGVELARQIREFRPDMPIVLMSGYTAGATLNAETSHFLHKPFTLEQLHDKLRNVLNGNAQLAAQEAPRGC